MDILPRISLCSDERSPYVALDFTQSVYLLYATVRHREVEGSNFSIMYANSSGHCVPYITVDGVSVRHVYNYTIYMHMYFIELRTRAKKWIRDYYLIVDTHQQ